MFFALKACNELSEAIKMLSSKFNWMVSACTEQQKKMPSATKRCFAIFFVFCCSIYVFLSMDIKPSILIGHAMSVRAI